jgi:hypothetical protein
VTVLFEVPIFHWGAALLRHVGHDGMLWLALLAFTGRVFGYTRLQPDTVGYLLALEPLHGVTYGLAWTAAVDKMNAEMPPEWQTTGQLLLNTVMWSVGRTAGSLFGGFYLEHGTFFGLQRGRALYMLASCGGLALLVCHGAASAILRACGRPGLQAPSRQAELDDTPPLLAETAPPPSTARRLQT